MANEIYDSTWWGNTIDTASSIGTSTDMIQGQFNMLTSNQPNLVTNGNFATDSDWTKAPGWAISDGVATYDGTGGTSSLVQNNIQNIELGKLCKVTINVLSNEGSGANTIFLGGTILNGSHLNVGSYTFFGSFTSNTNFYIYGRSGEVFKIDNVSVKEVRATTVEASKCLADAIHRIGIQDIQN